MIGIVSGSWTVLGQDGCCWKCKCRCGIEATKTTHFLKYNKSKGCLVCQRNNEHQKLLELIGTKVGTWNVVDYAGKNKHGSRQWLCVCECGKEQLIRTSYLTGKHKRKATICKACELRNMEESNRLVNEIPNRFWNKLQHVAARRGITLEITKEEAQTKFLTQSGRCALTGIPLYFTKLRTNYSRYTTASLDRIDSSKPYTLDNIQWLEKRINMMKNKYPQVQFIELCKLVANNN